MRLCLVFSASLFILAVNGQFSAAQAREQSHQKLVYDVYAGGIHVVEAKVDVHIKKDNRYSIVLAAQTRGFLGSLAPWQGVFESHGWIVGGDKFVPELHKSTTTWRGEDEISEYKYTKSGGFQELVMTEHGKAPEKKEVKQRLVEGTTDTLTAALSVFEAVAQGKNCEGTSDVFDGKRRYQQVFTHVGYFDEKPSKYNVFSGPAAECIVEVVPVTGAWHSKPRGWMSIQEQGRERGTMPTVWVAPVSAVGPAIPVKIRVKTAFGALYMHLSEYKEGEETRIAEQRAEQ